MRLQIKKHTNVLVCCRNIWDFDFDLENSNLIKYDEH